MSSAWFHRTLFSSTHRSWRTFAMRNSLPQMKRSTRACRSAAIHDKILSFPKGYNTKVGERGVKLSGGEVQRLAIARVFLKDPPILVLDEATSSVDTETESQIQGALKRLSRKRTTFVIAHRLSTVVSADQILVLHEGTIVERGSHEELLRKRFRYYNLWQKQGGLSRAWSQSIKYTLLRGLRLLKKGSNEYYCSITTVTHPCYCFPVRQSATRRLDVCRAE